MPGLRSRSWVTEACERRVQGIVEETVARSPDAVSRRINDLVQRNRQIHEHECFNLNPATNVMNPRAEALLAAGIGGRPSLGYPGDKYEMGLEAIEEIEVICATLAGQVFEADFAEIRVASGAMANLYVFMALCKPGDTIIAPPADIGGHVTHHDAGCAGLYGLKIYPAPVAADGYTVDVEKLEALAKKVRPRLITIGGSLNLTPHPVREIRTIAESIGCSVLFDGAHLCGLFAGKAWPNPLAEGAHLMTMSTYKSLAGPPGGLIVTNDADIAQRLDKIAFPGMTANFDAGKSAALAITLLDWLTCGKDYAAAMISVAKALATALQENGVPLFETSQGPTQSHQLAVDASEFGGGHKMAKHLRHAGFLASAIGLPLPPLDEDANGLRFGTPELVRWGVTERDVPEITALVAEALSLVDPSALASKVAEHRTKFNEIKYLMDVG